MSERLDTFRRNKYALYDKSNNMEDINNMSLFEFDRVTEYLIDKSKGKSGKFHDMSEKQKRMIKEAKE